MTITLSDETFLDTMARSMARMAHAAKKMARKGQMQE
jgi:hypothetical protein